MLEQAKLARIRLSIEVAALPNPPSKLAAEHLECSEKRDSTHQYNMPPFVSGTPNVSSELPHLGQPVRATRGVQMGVHDFDGPAALKRECDGGHTFRDEPVPFQQPQGVAV